MASPPLEGGRVMVNLVNDVQAGHRETILALAKILDCAKDDNFEGIIGIAAGLFPKLDEMKSTLAQMEQICRDAQKRGPRNKDKEK